MNSFAQDNNATTEELISLGPLTFSSKIDLGMLIAASAFASTIVYNYKQTRKAEKNLRREMEHRAVEQKQSMDAQQAQIEANHEQIQNDRRISEAGFWLTLRDQLAKYDDIDSYFLPGGKWMGWESKVVVEAGPENPEEWSKVTSYMSLLSLLNAMIDQGVISEEMFNRLYGYRVSFIYYNRIIKREQLEKNGLRWKEFLQLCLKRRHALPPFWVRIIIVTYIGGPMYLAVDVLDSYESLKSKKNTYVQNAKVTVRIFFPSGKVDHHEGITDERGRYEGYYHMNDENKFPGEGRVTVTISKEQKTSSELAERFRITEA